MTGERVCGFEAIDLLITDRAPDPEIAMRIREAGTELQITE